MEKIQEIVDLLDQHNDDVKRAKSNISKSENKFHQQKNIINEEIYERKNAIKRVIELEKSITQNEKKVYLQFLYSFILIGLILYMIF